MLLVIFGFFLPCRVCEQNAMLHLTAQLKGFKAFLLLERSFSGNSIDAYMSDVDKLTRFLTTDYPDVNLPDITLQHLTLFLDYLAHLGIATASRARITSGIKTFFRYLIIEGMLTQNPSELLEAPRITQKVPAVLSLTEIEAMIAAIDLSKPDGVRTKAIVEVLYGCGLRVSELTELKISHYYPQLGFVRIEGKGKKERLAPINPTAVKHLNIYLNEVRSKQPILENAQDFVFLNQRGGKLSRVSVFTAIKQLAAAADIQKKVSPHTFRHSFATHLFEGGADLRFIQDMLGHESITTTEIYAKADTQFVRDTLIQFHPRF